ncbi:MAG: 50S ribosomal protein L22 [Desulfotignum sp.]
MEAKKGYKAQVKHLLISPKKLRPIADTIRRKPYNQAIAILETTPKRGAGLIKKVVQSAVANALYQNNKLDEDSLYISEVLINEGPRMKRVRGPVPGPASSSKQRQKPGIKTAISRRRTCL